MRPEINVLSNLKHRYRAVATALDVRTERQLTSMPMPPIDRHLFLSSFYNYDDAGLFHSSYGIWTVRRIDKILELYGVDYFEGRRILELGCGHGNVGAFFAELGAEVVGLDGRVKNINYAKLRHRDVKGITFAQFDLEQDFTAFGRFDLIIDMGLIYHLASIDDHLRWSFATADEVIVETVVCDSTDAYAVATIDEDPNVDEMALHGTGVHPSPFYVERIAEERGFKVVRCFSSDLNTGSQFIYDWEHRNTGAASGALDLRRFWRFTRAA